MTDTTIPDARPLWRRVLAGLLSVPARPRGGATGPQRCLSPEPFAADSEEH